MLKINFVDGSAVEYLSAIETEEHFNGASRRTLTFTCDPAENSIDAINALLSEANLASLALTNDQEMTQNPETGETEITTVTNIYDGYVLKLACGIKSERIQAETPETPAVYADRLVIKLGKRTYTEQQQIDQAARLAALEAAMGIA